MFICTEICALCITRLMNYHNFQTVRQSSLRFDPCAESSLKWYPSFSPNLVDVCVCVCVCVCVWCVCVCVDGWMCKRVSVYVSEWVCVFAVPIYYFFSLAFVLVNDLSLVFCLFWKCIRFCFCFCCCFFSLYALVFYVYCCVIPDVLSLMFFHVPPLGILK